MFEWIEAFYNPADVTPALATSVPSSTQPFTPRRLLQLDRITHLSGDLVKLQSLDLPDR
jgi:hypothetical protein